jgi:alkyl sulfatase BDS1-like metallo-beta-lactamase superfamily hydrolase
MPEIASLLDWPDDLGAHFSIRGYYGSVNHNARAVYNFYLGYFDGNPAHLDPYPPVEAGRRYVALAGGPDALMKAAAEAYGSGDYRWTAELCSHLVFADPSHREARELEARAFEQLAFATENGVWRNFYLTGAKELREGPPAPTTGRAGGDLARALPIGLLFEYLAVRLNPERASGQRIRCNFAFTDESPWTLEVRHSVLLARRDHHFADAGVTLHCTAAGFAASLRGESNLMDDIGTGAVRIEGDLSVLFALLSLLDPVEGNFAIVEP